MAAHERPAPSPPPRGGPAGGTPAAPLKWLIAAALLGICLAAHDCPLAANPAGRTPAALLKWLIAAALLGACLAA